MAPVLYPVRTPPTYWLVLAAIVMCGLAGGGLAILALVSGQHSPTILGLGGLLAVVPVVYVLTTAEYRARGVIRLLADRVEVPGPRGEPLRFMAAGLRLRITRVAVRYKVAGIPVADVSRGAVIDLRSGALKRRISTLTLIDRDQAAALLEDLEALCRGEATGGPLPLLPRAPVGSPVGSSDRLERQLERELAALD